MFGFFKKALRLYLDIYGAPGTGVTVYSTPDSVLDFYRMSNVRLPLSEPRAPQPRKRRRPSIWGGQGAAHIVSFNAGAPCAPGERGCS